MSNFPLMKCLSISTHFVQSCWTRLWATLIVNFLSQYIFIFPSHLILTLSRMISTQRSSNIPCVIALNSVFVIDMATTTCFLLLQVIRFPPRNVQKAEVDLLSTTHPAQSASVYTSKFSFIFLLNRMSFPEVSFKYLRIL